MILGDHYIQYGTNFISVMPTNLYGPNDNFDLEKSHVLPAMIRKIHLAKLLSENNAQAVLDDLKMDNLDTALGYLKGFGVSSERVEIWGSGKPMREFLWSEDMADACIFLMENRDFKDLTRHSVLDTESNQQLDSVSEHGMTEIRNTHINIGTGVDISIHDLAYQIRDIVGYNGELYFNAHKPDGTMKKLTDVSKLHALGWEHTVELRDGITQMYNWYKDKNINGK